MGPLSIPPSNSPPGLREGRRRALHSQTTPTPPPEKTNNPKLQRQEEANVFMGKHFTNGVCPSPSMGAFSLSHG